MSEKLRVFGVDPGPTPGIAMLHYVDGRLGWANLVQATGAVSIEILDALLTNGRNEWSPPNARTLIGIERFVTRGRTNEAGRITLDMVGQVQQIGDDHDVAVLQRTASQVKAWATDVRLKAVQVPRTNHTLHSLATGMTHARDAARHAIFTASHDGLIPDPLSKSNNQQGART